MALRRSEDGRHSYLLCASLSYVAHTGLAPRHGVCAAVTPGVCRASLLHTDEPSFLTSYSSLTTPAVDNFVCTTMRDSYPDVWAANDLTSLGECARRSYFNKNSVESLLLCGKLLVSSFILSPYHSTLHSGATSESWIKGPVGRVPCACS